MSEILNRISADLWFVDFHGETTGEKETFAQVFADRCVMIVGTHTHVQTADEQLMRGCAYISDVGMCGTFDSILGRDKQEVYRPHAAWNQNPVYRRGRTGNAMRGVGGNRRNDRPGFPR